MAASEAAKHHETVRALGKWSWLESPWARLAGAAAVVVVVIWAATPTVNQRRSLPLMASGEGAGAAREFTWETPFSASRYRISVRDANGKLMFSAQTPAPPFHPDEAMRSTLTPGETYTWKVESLDSSGTIIGESLPVTFRYQP